MAESKAKRDFGSFHASNVQELLAMSEDEYEPPPIPFELPNFDHLKLSEFGTTQNIEQQQLQFGKAFRERHFLLEEGCTFLNHGAFGCVLKESLKVAQKWQEYAERQPLRFFDREILPHLVHVTRRLAKFVDCDPEDLALVTNATTGINSVVRCLKFAPGDIVVCFNITYGAVKKLLRQVCSDSGAQLMEVKIKLPISSPLEIVDVVKEAVSQACVKLIVLDHIPSNIPVILPVEQIIPVCRQLGVQVLVDGAHALGMVHLSMRRINADFYISNAHKWFCNPKGAAFLYVRKELKAAIRAPVVSHGYGAGFSSEFMWTGLKDYSPFLALHTTLDFWNIVNITRFSHYAYTLAKHAVGLLTSRWGTQRAATETMFGSMVLVELPRALYPAVDEVSYEDAERLQNELFHDFNIEVPIKAVDGNLYVRVSCHLHTSLDDIESLAQAVLKMIQSHKRQQQLGV